ncbi:MAG: hypothetical protein H7X95_07310, partial [Deltaproteobacteria bacterium]|nr:hypothetical protein [Deltaproteobacteria bacterium]
VALANRVLAADRVDAADDEAVAAGMARMRGTLDLAVEFLARGGGNAFDEDRAVDAVRTVAAIRLFRLGVSLIGKVRALAQALLRRGPFAALQHIDMVEEPEATVLAAVSRPRPLYAALLDDPPAMGERPFESLADIARATAAIQRAAVAQAMLLGLGVRPEHLVPEALQDVTPSDPLAIDTGVLARTALLLLMAQHEGVSPVADVSKKPRRKDKDSGQGEGERDVADFRPLAATEIAAFTRTASRGARPGPKSAKSAAAHEPGRMSDELRANARQILEQVAPPQMTAAARDMTERWLDTLSPLEPVLKR